MVFDLYGNDRLIAWKEFRDKLEISDTPFRDVVMLWGQAPFVSQYLDPNNPSEWPDPWHLILDNRLDDLAIALGMLYTLKLTRRFMDSKCEIHTSIPPGEKDPIYFLVVDKKYVLNLEYNSVKDVEDLEKIKSRLIWTKSDKI